jgi:hypothetical protein
MKQERNLKVYRKYLNKHCGTFVYLTDDIYAKLGDAADNLFLISEDFYIRMGNDYQVVERVCPDKKDELVSKVETKDKDKVKDRKEKAKKAEKGKHVVSNTSEANEAVSGETNTEETSVVEASEE